MLYSRIESCLVETVVELLPTVKEKKWLLLPWIIWTALNLVISQVFVLNAPEQVQKSLLANSVHGVPKSFPDQLFNKSIGQGIFNQHP